MQTALLSVSLSVLCIASAHAADKNWTGAVSTDASDPANWDTGTLPGAGDNAIFDTTAPNAAVFSGGMILPVNFLIVGNNNSGNLTVQGGATISPANNFLIGVAGGSSGVMTVTGSGSQVNAGNALGIGYGGDGVLLISNGGGIATTGETRLGVLTGSMGTARVEGSGSNLTVGSDLVAGDSGGGSLTIADGGKVSTGGKGFLGNASGSTGTAIVAGSGSTLMSTGDFATGFSGSGSLTISEGGTVEAASGFFLAVNNGSSGTLNIGAAQGDAAQAPGTLDTSKVTFGEGTGTLNFNHTSNNYTFAPGMLLNGTVNQIAGTTILTGDGTNFGGPTNVTGGKLIVNSNFLGTTVSVTGGTLGGTGKVGAANIFSGGTIAPGNSIGTLSFNASVNFNAGSVYEVEINSAGQSDLLSAPGFGTLAGTVRVVPLSGADPNTTYTILTAGGGVVGTFDNVIGTAFLTPTLSYDATNVFLNVSIASDFCLTGFTFNQCNSGRGAQSLGAGNTIYDAVLALATRQEAQDAFDAISGELHASAKTALIDDSRFVREAALSRLASAFDPVEQGDGPGAGEPAIWAHGFGAWGSVGGDGNAATLSRSTGGFFTGADGEIFDTWRFGVLGGYSHAGFSVGDRMSSGAADSYHLGAYGGTHLNDFDVRFGGAYSWHDIAIARSAAFTGFADNLSSSYRAGTGQLFGELAYGIEMDEARFEPFANLAHVIHYTPGFTEAGGPAALTGTSDVASATFTTLGVRAETPVAFGDMNAMLTGGLGWRHGFGDTPTEIHTFAGGNAFTVAGVPIDRDTLVLDAGFDVNIGDNATFSFAYNGQIGSGVSDHGVKANLGVSF